MTVLSDVSIREALAYGTIAITPLGGDAIRASSVDLRLGPILKIDDLNAPGGWRDHDLREGPFRLYRGVFVLGATLERVRVGAVDAPYPGILGRLLSWIGMRRQYHLCADLKGKSSRAREGLVLENAGFVDPGWDGELTTEMEMRKSGFLLLTLGMKIGQIRFSRLDTRSEHPYGSDETSHYQHSKGPVASRTQGGVR